MPLVTNREFENTYTSPDGSIFIDFDALENENNDADKDNIDEDE